MYKDYLTAHPHSSGGASERVELRVLQILGFGEDNRKELETPYDILVSVVQMLFPYRQPSQILLVKADVSFVINPSTFISDIDVFSNLCN